MRVIDPSQPLPVYVQLKTLLTEDIIRGRYSPGNGCRPSTSCAPPTGSVVLLCTARSQSLRRVRSSATDAAAPSSTLTG